MAGGSMSGGVKSTPAASPYCIPSKTLTVVYSPANCTTIIGDKDALSLAQGNPVPPVRLDP